MPSVISSFAPSRPLALLAAAAWNSTEVGETSQQLPSRADTAQTGFDRTPLLAYGGGTGGGILAALRNGLAGAVGAPQFAQDDSVASATPELQGQPDGPPLRLPSGIMLQKRQLGDSRVSSQELTEVVRSIYSLPAADVNQIANSGVPVHLLPVARLEDDLLGATKILKQQNGAWRPSYVRIAVRANGSGVDSTPEIVQHELGHVLAVLRNQDRTEVAAEQYARSF